MMEQESSRDPQKGQDRQMGNTLVALIGILAGLFLIGAAVGIVPIERRDDDPLWLLGAVGGIFFVAGIAAFGVDRFSSRLKDLFGAVMMTAFSVIAGWIAFGPGERVFNGGLYAESVGRVLFGVSAVLCGAIALWAWKRAIVRK